MFAEVMTFDRSIIIILRDALRDKGRKQILSEREYDALLHVSAKLMEKEMPEVNGRIGYQG